MIGVTKVELCVVDTTGVIPSTGGGAVASEKLLPPPPPPPQAANVVQRLRVKMEEVIGSFL